jgi:hypothetical protein
MEVEEWRDKPLRLSVKLLSPCQGGFAVWLWPSAFRRLAIYEMIRKHLAYLYTAHHIPLVVGFLSLLRFLRKLSWLNGLAESFCGEATLSAGTYQQDIWKAVKESMHTIDGSEICLISSRV